MMQGNFSKLKHEDLSKFALSYTSMLDEFGCVSLERTGQLTEKQSKSVCPHSG
ncbi:hypothetical protein M378DRAFT_171708 [Amanita muscaria Koide BX008]|uniref:Uncharacterized protein n=1 Tax=Amanita muscaria (strain Koide BX008) TaxID=946122 RepID=A0A0C2WLF7_AMAMK|nr:hypothetical protein M378DRAFT_171708 [Amanita muscaria Koide BX008]